MAQSSIEAFLFGSKDDPGFFGTGRRKVDQYIVDQGAAGIPGYDDWQNRLRSGADAAQQRQGPMLGQAAQAQAAQANAARINQGPQDQFRGQQSALSQYLMGQVTGQGPSVADAQLRQATDRNLQQAMAFAAANRGPSAGANLRQLGMQRAAIGQQAASDAGMLRLQEQMQAANQLGQVSTAARGQDIGLATSQAGLEQQTNLANAGFQQQAGLFNAGAQNQFSMSNQDAALRQRGLNDALYQYLTGQGVGLSQQQGAQNMALQSLLVNQNLGIEGLENQNYANAAEVRSKFIQQLLQQLGEATLPGVPKAPKSGGGK